MIRINMKHQIRSLFVIPFTILTIAILSGVGTVLFSTAEAKAAEIAKGGSAIETAVQITPGQYTGLPLAQDEKTFYKIPVNAGQELKVVGRFKPETNEYGGTMNTIKLYNEDRKEVDNEYDGDGGTNGYNNVTVYGLVNSEKASQIYYIEVSDDTWGTQSGELDVTITDCFDAESKTDAGGSIEKALTIKSGSHKGYLSQDDTDDYYSVPASAGKFSIKVTPNSKITPTVEIYDQSKTKIAEQTSVNAGQIFTLTADLTKTENIFIHFTCDINSGCENEARDYTFTTSTNSNDKVVQTGDSTNRSDTASGTQNTNNADKNTLYMWIGLAILAVILAIVITILIMRHHKKNPSTTSTTETPAEKKTTTVETPAPEEKTPAETTPEIKKG